MLRHDGDERRYTDEEFVLILRRATEIEGGAGSESLPVHPPWTDGLTLAEMVEVGREAGIAPDAVTEAAATLDTDEPGALDALLGGSLKLLVERTLDRRLPREAVDRVVDEAREVLGQQGEAREVPGGVEWRYDNGETRVLLLVNPRGGSTHIRMEVTRVGTAAFSYWIPTALAVLAGSFILGATDPHPTGVFILGMSGSVAAGLGLGRVFFATSSRAWDERVRRLLVAVTRPARQLDAAVP